MATLRPQRKSGPDGPEEQPVAVHSALDTQARAFRVGVHHNVAIPMSGGVALRADIHHPTLPRLDYPPPGRSPCCCA